MSTPPPSQPRRSAGDGKKTTPPPSSIVTRNGARKAKIQTRAMSSGGAKPSALVVAAKKKALLKKKHTVDTVLKDHYQIAMDSKSKVKGPTGFVTEPRMAEHRCLWDYNYPECPERLTSVIERCEELGLLDQCQHFPPRAATKEELLTLHSPCVYDMMKVTHQNNNLEYLEELSSKFDAVYIHPSTHELALLAAGSTIELVDRVVSGEVQNGAAFVRPPGHHAMRAEPCGYCVYNNVALAARHALDKRGLSRILIVDWDVHHGQATQQMFYDDPRVVYFSIHRYEHGAFWPSLRQSNFNYVGCGKGKGFNFNLPLNKTGMEDADYLAIWHQVLLPMAFEYQPELIIVSAGYDAAYGCPEFAPQLVIISAGFDSALGDEKGEMHLTPSVYGHLTHLLMSVCSSVCVVLEGGYCIRSLSEAAAITLRTLLGYRPPEVQFTEPCDEIRDAILNCIYTHKPYWSCFNYQPTYSTDTTIPNVSDREKQKHTVTLKWEGDETRPDTFPTRDCYPLQDRNTRMKIIDRLTHLRIGTDLSVKEHDVAYVYDEVMLKHKNICEPGHVECPERILRIHERHRDFGLMSRLHVLEPRAATDEEILAVHTEKHLNRLKELSSTKLRELNSQKEAFDSVYFHPDSLESAAMAAGCVIQAVDAVQSTSRSAVCIVRPPGHHADTEIPAGFCLLNNACIAARHAINNHGVKRAMILDWDVHHGNATQNITIDDNKILYISIHRYDNGTFFPHSTAANYDVVGEGRGEGYNVNIPWNKRGMGDVEYLAAFTQVVLPIAYEYNPEIVFVSAGFDACVGDPLGGCKVSPECYGRMTHLLQTLAAGKIILCLEGGYNVTSISYAMTMCTKALLGDPILHHYDPKQAPHPSAVESINNVIKTQKKYWKSLKFQLALPIENVLPEPAPSRGLIITDDQNISSRLSEVSICSSSNESMKSTSSFGSKNTSNLEQSLELSLESNMANLSLDKKCSDGIHCGTDDEDSKKESDQGGSSSSKKPDNSLSKPCVTGHQQKTEVNSCTTGKNKEESSVTGQEQNASSSKEVENQTLVDYLAANMQAISDGEMFAVIPLSYCPHLDSLFAIPSNVEFRQGVKCVECDHTVENWVCLHCYVTACGRSINGHMQSHFLAARHPLVLSLCDLSVWCNICDAYIDNHLLYDAKNNAHRSKFGEDMPWCYPDRTVEMQ